MAESEYVVDPYREMNERALAAARAMSPAEVLAVLRRIGICDENGDITPEYGGSPARPNGSTRPR